MHLRMWEWGIGEVRGMWGSKEEKGDDEDEWGGGDGLGYEGGDKEVFGSHGYNRF